MSYAQPAPAPKRGVSLPGPTPIRPGIAVPPPTQRGGKGPGSQLQQKPVGKPPVYDLSQIATDWTTTRNVRNQFDQDVTIVLEQLRRQRDPTTPYLNVPAEDAMTNLAKQVIDPTLAFLIAKSKAYNLSGNVTVACPPESNSAPPRNLGLVEKTIDFTFDLNEQVAPTHFSQGIIEDHIQMHGWVVGECWYCNPDDAHMMLGGYPIKLTLHDPFTVAHELDPDGSLRRVIVARRILCGELPDKWRTGQLAGRLDTDEVVLFEDFNKYKFAAVIDNVVVDQYDHGFLDHMGQPMVPFVIELHMPLKTRLGDAPPQLGYSTPRDMWIGQPAWMDLIGMAKYKSFLLTSERWLIRENVAPWEVISGGTSINYDNKRITKASKEDTFEFAQPNNVLANIEAGLQRVATEEEAGGIGQAALAGQPVAASGVSAQGQTALPRQMMQAARQTRERFLARLGLMIVGHIKNQTGASDNRRFQAATGRQIVPRGHRDFSPHFANSDALPYYAWVTGDPRVPVDSLTVAGVVAVRVGATPIDALPKEQAIQLFMNITQMEKDMGKLIVPKAYKYGELLGVSNPQAFITQTAVDQFEDDPATPAGKVRVLREVAQQRLADENSDPAFWTNALAQLQQVEESASQQTWSMLLAQVNAPTPAPGAQAPPGAAPPQPPGPQPMQQGAPPAPMPPGGPVAALGSGQPMPGAPPSLPTQIGGNQQGPPMQQGMVA